MNMDKLYKINKIEKKILELEDQKQSLFDLGLDDEDRYNEFMKLDDKIDELMQEHSEL